MANEVRRVYLLSENGDGFEDNREGAGVAGREGREEGGDDGLQALLVGQHAPVHAHLQGLLHRLRARSHDLKGGRKDTISYCIIIIIIIIIDLLVVAGEVVGEQLHSRGQHAGARRLVEGVHLRDRRPQEGCELDGSLRLCVARLHFHQFLIFVFIF
jgi:hypothetical protein